MYGPKYLLFINRRFIVSDDRTKHQEDSSKNGVVGSNGKKIPIKPSTADNKPIACSNMRTTFVGSFLFVSVIGYCCAEELDYVLGDIISST